MRGTKKILLAVLFVVFMSYFVSAATITIRPNGQGSNTAWTNVGCTAANEWQCVDEATVNTSDYLYNTGTGKETFLFSDTGLSSTVTINSVTMYYYATWQTSSANSCFAAMTRNGTKDYLSGVQLCVNGSYQYKSHTYNKNPATNSSWTVSEVDNLQAGMYALDPNGGGRVAQVYAIVNYTYNVDLIIENISFLEYGVSNATGNFTFVNVTTIVKNVGSNTAGNSTTRLKGIYSLDRNTPSLASGASYELNWNYQCSYGHNFNATADYYNVVGEDNEVNNVYTRYIDCVI